MYSWVSAGIYPLTNRHARSKAPTSFESVVSLFWVLTYARNLFQCEERYHTSADEAMKYESATCFSDVIRGETNATGGPWRALDANSGTPLSFTFLSADSQHDSCRDAKAKERFHTVIVRMSLNNLFLLESPENTALMSTTRTGAVRSPIESSYVI